MTREQDDVARRLEILEARLGVRIVRLEMQRAADRADVDRRLEILEQRLKIRRGE